MSTYASLQSFNNLLQYSATFWRLAVGYWFRAFEADGGEAKPFSVEDLEAKAMSASESLFELVQEDRGFAEASDSRLETAFSMVEEAQLLAGRAALIRMVASQEDAPPAVRRAASRTERDCSEIIDLLREKASQYSSVTVEAIAIVRAREMGVSVDEAKRQLESRWCDGPSKEDR